MSHITGVTSKVIVGIIFLTRVMGMAYQWTRDLPTECLAVTEYGLLVQTPFTSGCLNGFDWAILVLAVFLFLFLVLSFTFMLMDSGIRRILGDFIKEKWNFIKNIILERNDSKFYINGDRLYRTYTVEEV